MRRFIFLGLCLVGILSPVIYLTEITFLYNEKRIIVAAIIFLAGVLAVFSTKKEVQKSLSLLPAVFYWCMVCVLIISIISAFLSAYPFYSIVEISLFLLLFWSALLAAKVVNIYEFGKYVVIASACLAALFYTIKFGLGYAFHLLEFKDFPLWPASGLKTGTVGFGNIRFFNQIQVFTLPLILGGSLLAMQRQKIGGYFLLVLAGFWWMLLIQSAGRGIILSTLSAALVTLIVFKKYMHRWVWYFLGTLLVGYMTKVLLFDVIPADAGSAKSIVRGGSPRITLWPQTFFASLEKPILGHGPMTFANINLDFTPSHPHNSILQLLYEFGYPVTIAVLGGVYCGLRKWIVQTANKLKSEDSITGDDSVIRISLTAAILGGLIYSLLSGVIVMPLSQLWLAIVSGTILGLYHKDNEWKKNLKSTNFYKTVAFKVVMVIASIIMVSVLVKDIPTLRANEQKFVEETDRKVLRPRFWQQGKIGLDSNPSKDKQSQQ